MIVAAVATSAAATSLQLLKCKHVSEACQDDPGVLEELNDKLRAKAYFSWLRHKGR